MQTNPAVISAYQAMHDLNLTNLLNIANAYHLSSRTFAQWVDQYEQLWKQAITQPTIQVTSEDLQQGHQNLNYSPEGMSRVFLMPCPPIFQRDLEEIDRKEDLKKMMEIVERMERMNQVIRVREAMEKDKDKEITPEGNEKEENEENEENEPAVLTQPISIPKPIQNNGQNKDQNKENQENANDVNDDNDDNDDNDEDLPQERVNVSETGREGTIEREDLFARVERMRKLIAKEKEMMKKLKEEMSLKGEEGNEMQEKTNDLQPEQTKPVEPRQEEQNGPAEPLSREDIRQKRMAYLLRRTSSKTSETENEE